MRATREGGRSETAFETSVGKCECIHARDRVRLCACVLFGGTKLVFVAAGILSRRTGRGKPGKSGYGHLGCLYRPISSSHIRLLVPPSRPAPAYLETQRHWISSPSSSARPPPFSSFSPSSSSFFSFCFAHPLTRAAGRFQQKCDTNGAIEI